MNEIKELINEKKAIFQDAIQQIKVLERAESKKRKRILTGDFENGRLIAEARKGGSYYYILKPDGQRIYLKKNSDFRVISCLAQKEYNEKLSNWLEKQMNYLNRIERACPETDIHEVYNSLHPGRKDMVQPIFISDEEYAKQWEETPYTKNDFVMPENLEDVRTKKGEAVRSKSEKIIADMLFDNNVPYRYEPEIVFDDGRRVFPDFMVLNKRTRKEYLWEHLGMMDNLEYVDHNILKLRHYEQNGYLLGSNLILTYETATMQISTTIIQKYSDSNLL